MIETELTRRRFLSLTAVAALLPPAPAPPGPDPAGPAAPRVQGPLHYSSPAGLSTLIAAREPMSMDITQQLLARIAAVDGRLQSHVTVMSEHAITRA